MGPSVAWFAITLLTVWTVLTVLAATVMGALDWSNQQRYLALIHHGATISATVTRTDPADHNSVYYTFSTGGERYSSADSSEQPNPSAGALRVGQSLAVVYDVRNPNVSCACDPRDGARAGAWWRQLLGGAFVSSVVAVVITLGRRRRWRNRAALTDR